MEKKTLQDRILTKLQRERQVVKVIVTNGFQMTGRITGFDRYVVVVEIRNEQQIVYKSAISTISPDRPIDLNDLGKEAS